MSAPQLIRVGASHTEGWAGMTAQAKVAHLERLGLVRPGYAGLLVLDDADKPLDLQIEQCAQLAEATLRGRVLIGEGTKVGLDGRVVVEDSQIGRDVKLEGPGKVSDSTVLDGGIYRQIFSLRGGALMEEGVETRQSVDAKGSIFGLYVVAGSLINFSDAYMFGGMGRKDHSEIGSGAVHFNFQPAHTRGDKWGSLFGSVATGVLMLGDKVFVGGNTSVIGPIIMGDGSVLAAGSALRRSVGPNRLVSEVGLAVDTAFDPFVYGNMWGKFSITAEIIGNLHALKVWYEQVRLQVAEGDEFQKAMVEAGIKRIDAIIAERIKRLGVVVDNLPESVRRIRAGGIIGNVKLEKRVAEQETLIAQWERIKTRLERDPDFEKGPNMDTDDAAGRVYIPESIALLQARFAAERGSYIERAQRVRENQDAANRAQIMLSVITTQYTIARDFQHFSPLSL